MATIRLDIIVVGSSLGGLVAGAYLARAGLHVAVLEEELHASRPPLLRDPFLLSGLEIGGGVQRSLGDIGVSPSELRKLRRYPVALQVLLPGTRIDVPEGRARLSRELQAFGLLSASETAEWLELVDSAGDASRRQLWESKPATRLGRLLELWRRPPPQIASLPPAPEALRGFIAAQMQVLSGQAGSPSGAAAALLLRSVRDGGTLPASAGELFSDLLRQRLHAHDAEIRPLGEFSLAAQGGEIQLELPNERLSARSLIVAAPRGLVGRAAAGSGSGPRWLRRAPQPREIPVRLFRAEREALPGGLARRAVVAPGGPEQTYWIARHDDPERPGIEWLAIAGPGAEKLPANDPLGALGPFSDGRVVAVDAGPSPKWDRDASDLRFPATRLPAWLKRNPPIVAVGPEVEPGTGFEGEVQRARAVALRLIDRLGARRKLR